MSEITKSSPLTDSNGRDLYRVVVFMGTNRQVVYMYAFGSAFAMEKARNVYAGFSKLKVSRVM